MELVLSYFFSAKGGKVCDDHAFWNLLYTSFLRDVMERVQLRAFLIEWLSWSADGKKEKQCFILLGRYYFAAAAGIEGLVVRARCQAWDGTRRALDCCLLPTALYALLSKSKKKKTTCLRKLRQLFGFINLLSHWDSVDSSTFFSSWALLLGTEIYSRFVWGSAFRSDYSITFSVNQVYLWLYAKVWGLCLFSFLESGRPPF